MSQHHFGCRTGKLTRVQIKVREAAAKKHDADFVHVRLPGEGWRSWFSCSNLGHPFDDARARAVLAEFE